MDMDSIDAAVASPAAARRDADEYTDLVLLHGDAVYAAALRILRDPEDARDAAQEALLAGWRFLHQRRPELSARGWLVRIARNKAFDEVRRRRPCVTVERAEDPRLGVTCDPAPAVIDRLGLLPAFEQLVPAHRDILLLRVIGDLSEAETACALRVPLGTVKQRLHRARHALAEALSKQAPGTAAA